MARLTQQERKKVQKPLLWVGLASIVMTFAGLTSGYVVSRSALLAENAWLQFALPQEFIYATAAILLSSITIAVAVRMARKDNLGAVKGLLWLTLLLGMSFVFLQYFGWQDLIERGLYFTGPNSNTASSWVYVITVLHWVHVISGLLVLMYTLNKANQEKYTSEDYQGLTVSAIYWHFLDGLWLYLFLFLSFIR